MYDSSWQSKNDFQQDLVVECLLKSNAHKKKLFGKAAKLYYIGMYIIAFNWKKIILAECKNKFLITKIFYIIIIYSCQTKYNIIK